MPTIEFLPSSTKIAVSEGTLIHDAAKRAGVHIHAPCGQKGTCGKCIVQVRSGQVDRRKLGLLTREEIAQGYALACQTRVGTEDLEVFVPQRDAQREGQFSDSEENMRLIRVDLFPRQWQFDTMALKWLFEVPPPESEDGLSDIDRLSRSVRQQW
ncbi:MAG: 2Fe-2S iron-sulfur cluster binding domain-containing protein, partial [Planctomycetes bacterium]|nr:2Fe-2S iron-sulfur cluster binding domain-containing protein [Planctomycetota bacterium]